MTKDKEWSLKEKELTGWIRTIDDIEIECISIDKNLKSQPIGEIKDYHFEKDDRRMYLKDDIDTLRRKIMEDIFMYYHNLIKKDFNLSKNKLPPTSKEEIFKNIEMIISRRFGLEYGRH